MKKTTIIIVMAMLCLNFGLKAQTLTDTIKPQTVWNKLPEQFWQQQHQTIIDDQITEKNLSAYKGKFLILDFWATWCGACLQKFPLLDSLAIQFKDRLAIISVNAKITRDAPDKIRALMQGKIAPFKKFNLFTIINDEYLSSLFPHRGIPFYVWINEKGKIVAITGSQLITKDNIEGHLNQD